MTIPVPTPTRRTLRPTATAFAMLSVLVLAGCGSLAASANSDSAALVQSRCTRCHPIDRIKSAQHDAAGWATTIARMQGKGAQVDDTQAAAIATFLANGGAGTL